MSCDFDDVGGCIVKDAISSGIEGLADATADGAEWAIEKLTTAWLYAPSPDVDSSHSVTTWLQDQLSYFVLAVVLGSVLVAAWRLATTRRFEHARELAESLVRVVLVSAAVAFVTALAIEIGDLFSDYILNAADLELEEVVVFAALRSQPMVLFLVAFVVLLAQLIQLGLMLVRNGMILLLAGVLPLAAAASNTQMGKQWWQKASAWLLAFLLYKPTAAIIYAGTFMMASEGQDVTTQISGAFMLVLAVFALPALLRFLVPATSAMAAGNAGAMSGAVVGGTLATGAVMATGGAAGGGFSAGTAAMRGAPVAAGATGAGGASGSANGGGPTGGTGGSGPPGAPGPTTPGRDGAHRGTGSAGGGGPGTGDRSASPASGASTDIPGPAPSGGRGHRGGHTRWSIPADAARHGSSLGRSGRDTASGAVGEDNQ